MKTTIKLILGYLLLLSGTIYAQDEEWVRVFGDDQQTIVLELTETYDGGYLIGGHTQKIQGNGALKDGVIYKTDINGNVLWKKVIGRESDLGTDGTQLAQTEDGSFILLSGTYKYGLTRNVMLMKLNECGEKEWNKIFVDEYQSQWNTGLSIMDDGSYLIMLSYWGDDLVNERIWLFKISVDGDIIWQKVYAQWPGSYNNEEGYHLLKNNENEYLITGKYFHPNPGEDTNARWKRPMFIKIDSTGNEIWHLLWGAEEYFYGSAAYSIFNSQNNIYGVGRNESIEPDGYQGAMFKLDAEGNQLFHRNVPEGSKTGIATTISLMQDSILYIGSTWSDWGDNDHTSIFKTDTLGNILKEKELLQESNTFTSSLITRDNKYLVTGSFYIDHSWDIYLWKLNKELEFDSIYTQPRVYDSLCPYPIISDTIELDTTTVNLHELYKQMHQIKVHPNPASTKLFVSLGDLAQGDEIKLYNTKGQIEKHIAIQPFKRECEIDVSTLRPGMYVVVLESEGKVVSSEKVIIRR